METWLTPRRDRPAGVVVGTMNFGKRTPEAEARRIMHRALDRGVFVFDTANVYNDGESERIVGRVLRGVKEARIATKCGIGMLPGPMEGLSAPVVRKACEDSLRRLEVERIDLYYLHRPDPKTPFDETIGAIHDLLRQGKIANWGVSNFASWQILEMNGICERASMPLPAVSQEMYNLLIRQLDIEYFAFAKKHPIHTTVYNPLAGGLLAGKGLRQDPEPGSRFDRNPMYQKRYLSDRLFEVTEAYGKLARDAGMTLVDLAYRFVAAQPGVDSVLLGPATVEQLDVGIDACARPLPVELGARIDDMHRAYLGTDATYARVS
jgi:aryl-alcohol dehydrogenase-like predicted oxidoreductase